ncbi:hypothetical protein B0O99DRAFT_696695 [Bisporella sp. PMI_857]|nr:hypothetical protein B0O99DRAFT_696695 [Bisporella sp. PMI_857]
MTFKAINDSAGLNGIVLILLVFGAYLRITELDASSPLVSQRSTALKKAQKKIQKLRAKRKVADVLQARNGSSMTAIYDFSLNSEVLKEKNCVIALFNGPVTFRSTSVKLYFTRKNPEELAADNEEPEAIELISDFITVEVFAATEPQISQLHPANRKTFATAYSTRSRPTP